MQTYCKPAKNPENCPCYDLLLNSRYDHIDVPLCKSLGIKVGNTPDVLSPSVAEVAVFLTLMVLRRVKEMIA